MGFENCEAYTLEIDATDKRSGKDMQWGLTLFLNRKKGETYIPDILAGEFRSEANLFLCASFDGVGVITEDGHSYFPVSWLKKEVPQLFKKYPGIQTTIDKCWAKGSVDAKGGEVIHEEKY